MARDCVGETQRADGERVVLAPIPRGSEGGQDGWAPLQQGAWVWLWVFLV